VSAPENGVDTSAGDGVYSGALTNPTTVPVAEGLPSQAQILEALKVVKDPEIPVNVVDLGLIYGVDINTSGNVEITMTLTSVGCPVQDLIRSDAEMAVMRLDGVNQVEVEFVWSPPWAPDKMSDDGKRQMRMFGFNV
jgi:metal-sulfur cluster biosynthetic enzyme